MDAVDATRRVFISYTAKDRSYAETILKALEHRGIGCWFAPRDVPGGANWTGTIWRAIQTAEAMVVVLSRNANGSGAMKKEVNGADQRKIAIIAVRIDTADLDADWSYEFSVRHMIDGSMGLEHIIRNLGDQLQGVRSGTRDGRPVAPLPGRPTPPPARPAAPLRWSPVASPETPWGALTNATRKFGSLLQSGMVPLVVLASAVVISLTVGVFFLSGSGSETTRKSVILSVGSNPVVTLPVRKEKCDGAWVSTYPRPPGTC
jgi:hypothetical protein